MECGSQFSVALTKSGAVYTWYVQHSAEQKLCHELSYQCCYKRLDGSVVRMYHVIPRGKGDYHRLGHGSDDHVRRPRQVQGLQGKKVIAIATGSLHCVCCTEDGRIDHFVHDLFFCTYCPQMYDDVCQFVSDQFIVQALFGIIDPTVQLSQVELQLHGKLCCCVWLRRSVHMGRQR